MISLDMSKLITCKPTPSLLIQYPYILGVQLLVINIEFLQEFTQEYCVINTYKKNQWQRPQHLLALYLKGKRSAKFKIKQPKTQLIPTTKLIRKRLRNMYVNFRCRLKPSYDVSLKLIRQNVQQLLTSKATDNIMVILFIN